MGMLQWVYASFFWTQTVWKCRKAVPGCRHFRELLLGYSLEQKSEDNDDQDDTD